ncbi:hypothetical protein GCM10010912_68650 [Paenibacillus albidus]|uniref:Uncharacterized protein n=1 Tax=Paenibacillus albidus TaxID=2041023 RepID=A0A917FYR9_9BACL|nr:nucleoid-associated protein [Paenibacillus albidus]GGG14458.1 hypothetical protein GCM10010912_68650 [Paenibacillus albidus]
MRNISDISIGRAILHGINNKPEARSISLSDLPMLLEPFERRFITNHILTSMNDEKIRAANFIIGENQPNLAKDALTSLLLEDNEQMFVDKSIVLTNHLANAMRSHHNISSAEIIICTYSDNHNPEQVYAAVLKLDYKSSIVRKEQKEVIDGIEKIRHVISEEGLSLPDEDQKLQKCAFVQLTNEQVTDFNYEILFLDKQNKGEAIFFKDLFLKCDLVLNDRVKTERFSTAVKKWLVSNKGQIGIEKYHDTINSLNSNLRNNETVNINSFIEHAIKESALKQSFIQSLRSQGFVEDEFTIDKAWVRENMKRVTIEFENNIVIRITPEQMDDETIYKKEQTEPNIAILSEIDDVQVYKLTGRLSRMHYDLFFIEAEKLFLNAEEASAVRINVSHDFGNDSFNNAQTVQRYDRTTLSDDTFIEFVLRKNDLLVHAQHTYLFMFEQNLLSFLNKSFEILEENLKISDCKKTTLLIADQTYSYENGFFRFIGTDLIGVSQFTSYVTTETASQVDIIDSRHHLVNWEEGPKYLTPNHFYFSTINDERPLEIFLTKKLVQLCIAYMSNYINNQGIATLKGFRTVHINSFIATIKKEFVSSLYEIFRWAYDERVHDKIEIIRNLVSIQLGTNVNDNSRLLSANAADIFSAVKSNYSLLIKDNVGLYFQERGKAETYITDISNQVSKGITDLIDFSSKQLLAFFVAVAGSFAAYATNEKQIIVFIGIILFAFYLIVSSAYYMIYIVRIFKGWEFDYQHRKKNWQSIFTPDEIQNITSDDELFGQRKRLFYKNWRISLYINLLLLLLSLIGLIYLTNIIDYLFHHKKSIEEIIHLILGR